MRFEISFYGHRNVRSTHQKTIEVTSKPELTAKGDCIIGVKSTGSCKDIPDKMKHLLRNSKSRIVITIMIDGLSFRVRGKGHENLILSHPHDIVIRKSSFMCPRTLAIKCDKASHDIPRDMIKALNNRSTKGIFAIDVI